MIAEATRTRITQLAAEHGFQINQSARNLRLKRTGAIGVVPFRSGMKQPSTFRSLLRPGPEIGPLADALAGRGYDACCFRASFPPIIAGWTRSSAAAGWTASC